MNQPGPWPVAQSATAAANTLALPTAANATSGRSMVGCRPARRKPRRTAERKSPRARCKSERPAPATRRAAPPTTERQTPPHRRCCTQPSPKAPCAERRRVSRSGCFCGRDACHADLYGGPRPVLGRRPTDSRSPHLIIAHRNGGPAAGSRPRPILMATRHPPFADHGALGRRRFTSALIPKPFAHLKRRAINST